ncbi:MAG TPA: UbiA family prenyltransferase [Amycolatopsis sp.]|uniref:UbiA family prenyltransferase n=1 Tax=Amycolatopsis sp. TaxID=37632 RepID=UPI002B47623B|nr:UbiA family prenyltransferase [Amycolatopsis sp.]HKS50133.1 UbiA family prenyltransferase [Amycolatopsis sp.]
MATGTAVGVRFGRRLLAHVEIWRLDTVFYIGPVTLSGALFAGGGHGTGWRVAAAWLAPTLGWVASLYGGDYFDRELDAVAKPGRPIPSGRMSPRTAFAGMVMTIVAGTVIAAALNPRNLVLVVASTVMGVLYAKVFKARGLAGNLIRGGPTAAAFALGTMAVRALPPWPVIVLGLIFWLHDSASNLVGTICDREGDREGGYRTIPVLRGDASALRTLIVLDLLWIVAAVAAPAVFPARAGLRSYYSLLAVAIVLTFVSAAMLLRAPRPIPRVRALPAHEVIVIERLILACGFLAAAANLGLAFAVGVPAVLATFGARFVMRQRDHPSLARRWFRNRSTVRS